MLICFLEWLYHFTVPLALDIQFLSILTSIWCCHSFRHSVNCCCSFILAILIVCGDISFCLCVCVFLTILFIYLFLAVLGLCCCAGFSLVAVSGLLVAEWLLLLQSLDSRHEGFSSCGSRALEHRLSSCGDRALLASRHVGSSWIRD